MFAAPGPQDAPRIVARPDRASFLVAAPSRKTEDEVLEVDGVGGASGASPALLARLPCGGRIAQLGVSVSSATGQAVLAAVLEAGLVELWDLEQGGGPGALLDVVHLPQREKLLKAAAAAAAAAGKDAPLPAHRCLLVGAPATQPLFFLSVVAAAGSSAAGAAPAVSVLSCSSSCASSTWPGNGGGARLHAQRLDAVDASRRKAPAVRLGGARGQRPPAYPSVSCLRRPPHNIHNA